MLTLYKRLDNNVHAVAFIKEFRPFVLTEQRFELERLFKEGNATFKAFARSCMKNSLQYGLLNKLQFELLDKLLYKFSDGIEDYQNAAAFEYPAPKFKSGQYWSYFVEESDNWDFDDANDKCKYDFLVCRCQSCDNEFNIPDMGTELVNNICQQCLPKVFTEYFGEIISMQQTQNV